MSTENVSHSPADEAGLVRAAQLGDREAFAQLYEGNVGRVYSYLLTRMSKPADAEDITADVFIKAMQGLPSYRHRGAPFAAWLLRIAHNEMVNLFKKQARRRETPIEPASSVAVAADDPAHTALSRVAGDEVRQAMKGLTDLQQQVLGMRFGAELSIAETAEAMGRSEGAVKFLQHSALHALQGRLTVEGEEHHGG